MFPTLPVTVKPQTVSALTAQIKTLLEESFPSVWVSGEIGSLVVAGSGHVYFNLKDKNAILPSVMWKATAVRHRYAMKDGQEVVVRGRITVYPPHGKYQLTVDELYQVGLGDQDQALRKLKEKLQKLGYFAPERKKTLPSFPQRIALVTSPSGAAIRDMLQIISRRWPCAEVWVCGVRVQGTGAPQEIASALDRLNGFAGIDVILLGRGGGSSEDLAAFNDEIVANAIFASRIPIVSAVGHEIDITIADLVADRRAATPSEAAELTTPDRMELMQTVHARRQRLHDLLIAKYQFAKKALKNVGQRRVFASPLERVRDEERRLDDLDERLQKAMRSRLQRAGVTIGSLASQLESLSPLNVLARGYSLTRTVPDNKVVRSVKQIAKGDRVEIIVADGKVQAKIIS